MNRSGFFADLIGAALLIAVGSTMAIMSLDYDLLGRNGLIRPGFMPFLAGGFMALFGVAVGVSALRQRWAYAKAREIASTTEPSTSTPAAGESEPVVRTEDEAGTDGRFNKRVAIVFGLTLATILAAPVLGFILAFGLLILVLLVVIEREPLWIGVVISGVASFATWLVFVYWLRIPLPSGIF